MGDITGPLSPPCNPLASPVGFVSETYSHCPVSLHVCIHGAVIFQELLSMGTASVCLQISCHFPHHTNHQFQGSSKLFPATGPLHTLLPLKKYSSQHASVLICDLITKALPDRHILSEFPFLSIISPFHSLHSANSNCDYTYCFFLFLYLLH